MARINKASVPKAILNKPRLNPGLDLYYQAFLHLSTCRQIGMAEGPIPWTAVRAYADDMGMQDDWEFQRLLALVNAMDVAYIGWRAKKRKA